MGKLVEAKREYHVGYTGMLVVVTNGRYDHPLGLVPRLVAEKLGLDLWREGNGTGCAKTSLFEIVSAIDSYNNPDPLGTWVVSPVIPMTVDELEVHLQKAYDDVG